MFRKLMNFFPNVIIRAYILRRDKDSGGIIDFTNDAAAIKKAGRNSYQGESAVKVLKCPHRAVAGVYSA